MPSAEWVNLSAACEKVVAVALRGAAAPGERVGTLANGGERRRRRLGAAGDRIGRALELTDHSAEFQFEQFEDLPGGIGVRSAAGTSATAADFAACGSTAGTAVPADVF